MQLCWNHSAMQFLCPRTLSILLCLCSLYNHWRNHFTWLFECWSCKPRGLWQKTDHFKVENMQVRYIYVWLKARRRRDLYTDAVFGGLEIQNPQYSSHSIYQNLNLQQIQLALLMHSSTHPFTQNINYLAIPLFHPLQPWGHLQRHIK